MKSRGWNYITIRKELVQIWLQPCKKKISRRKNIEVGLYTEIYFPKNNVRYIAINDNFDSMYTDRNELAPFKNLFNEWFARDTILWMKKRHPWFKKSFPCALRDSVRRWLQTGWKNCRYWRLRFKDSHSRAAWAVSAEHRTADWYLFPLHRQCRRNVKNIKKAKDRRCICTTCPSAPD